MDWKLLIIFLLSSCSAAYHLEKACEKEPTICTPEQITLVDTVIIPQEAVRDTFVLSKTDTIEIERERVRIELRRSYDTLEVFAECKTDTIIKTIQVDQPKPIEIVKGVSVWWQYSWYVVIILLIVTLLKNAFKGFLD